MLQEPLHFILKKRALPAFKMWGGGWASVQNRKFSSIPSLFSFNHWSQSQSASLTCASRWRGQPHSGPPRDRLHANSALQNGANAHAWALIDGLLLLVWARWQFRHPKAGCGEKFHRLKCVCGGFRHVCFKYKIPAASQHHHHHHYLTN